MTESSEKTYVYDAQGRQTAVIYGPVNAAGV
jgi:hypothetical protein